MQKTQCVSGKYVRSARSVHSGSGVKNAVCVHRRWRRTNPELDHGWVKRLTCANGTWMTSLSCEVEVWDRNHQWFLMYALYLTTALLHTFTSIWFFFPPHYDLMFTQTVNGVLWSVQCYNPSDTIKAESRTEQPAITHPCVCVEGTIRFLLHYHL